MAHRKCWDRLPVCSVQRLRQLLQPKKPQKRCNRNRTPSKQQQQHQLQQLLQQRLQQQQQQQQQLKQHRLMLCWVQWGYQSNMVALSAYPLKLQLRRIQALPTSRSPWDRHVVLHRHVQAHQVQSHARPAAEAAGKSPPVTQADLRAVQVELALLIAGHTTEIAQLQTTMGAHQATVVGASSDMDEMRVQISSYSDAMTASEERLIAMMSPLIEETHATSERLTELDLQMKALRIELRQRSSQPQQYDVHTPTHPGRTVGADDPWQPRPEAGRPQAPRAPAAPSAGGLGHDSTFASAPPTMGTEQRQPQFQQQEAHFVPPAAAPSSAPHNMGGSTMSTVIFVWPWSFPPERDQLHHQHEGYRWTL